MKSGFLICILSFAWIIPRAQDVVFEKDDFILSGDATEYSDQCFRLTSDRHWQGGGVWFDKPIDLHKPFEMEIDISFGCDDEGADGIVFIFHPELTTGFQGEGMGFGGLYPSLGVEMDTYENYHLGDPRYDHVALMHHGRVHHGAGITEPVPLAAGGQNVEDCGMHRVKISWSPSGNIFQFSFDGSVRIQKKINLIDQIFLGNSFVYWGFTSATGGKYNTHLVCLERLKFTSVNVFPTYIRELLLGGDPYILDQLDFPSGSTSLPRAAHEELDKLVRLLKSNPGLSVFLSGFTDSSGDADQNRSLSLQRASAVGKYLIRQGIDPKRIHSSGLGETNPIAPNDTAEGRRKNRRIEVALSVLRT